MEMFWLISYYKYTTPQYFHLKLNIYISVQLHILNVFFLF